MLEKIKSQSRIAINELLEKSNPKAGDIVVIGCSTSEVAGSGIGTNSSLEIADAIFEGIYPAVKEKKLYLAAQCCEHLNRAIVIEQELADKLSLETVNVVPKREAGSSFAQLCFERFENPAVVEEISAVCGIDIGGTLIGMNLKRVAVPVRLSVKNIGEAMIICARTRPKFIGGERAVYDLSKM